MFNWLARMFTGRRTLREATPHLEAVARHNGYMNGNPAEGAQGADAYAASPWVYIAVNRIAEAAALVPLHVYRGNGEALPGHPLERLLANPNPFMSRFELLEATVGTLELAGNAYWYLAGDARGRPAGIWPLRSDRVRIVPDAGGYVKGYVYEIDGVQVPLEPVEVVHFKRWHPLNDYYGLSALTAARLAVQTDRAMGEWNRSTFGQDYGVPAGIVSIKEFVSDADFERIKREWRESYGGPGRRTAFMRGGGVEWQPVGLSHTDLDFLQGRQANRDEILNVFGVPVGLVSENATEANAKVAERAFIERTLWPKLARLGEKITQALLPFWPDDTVARFDDIRPTDTQARLAEIRAAYPVLSVNEIREKYYHLGPVDWGARPASGKVGESAGRLELPESSGQAESGKAARLELAQWERFALKRIDVPDARPFNVAYVPDEVAFEVAAGLAAADDAESVRQVFQDAHATLEADSSPKSQASDSDNL